MSVKTTPNPDDGRAIKSTRDVLSGEEKKDRRAVSQRMKSHRVSWGLSYSHSSEEQNGTSSSFPSRYRLSNNSNNKSLNIE